MDTISKGLVGVMESTQQTCATCLERRVQCDRQTPPCGQCLEDDLPCRAYSRGQRFVEEPPTAATSTDRAKRKRLLGRRGQRGDGGDATALIVSQDGLARKTHEASYVDLYWRAYLPNSRELPEEVLGNLQGRIVKSVQAFSREQGPMRKILLALALTTAGRMEDNSDWVQRGIQIHGKALAEVSTALKTKDPRKSDEVMAAIRYFGLYEVLHGSQARVEATERGTHLTVQSLNWQAHIHGDLAIMHARGPTAFVDGDAHAIFVDGRSHHIAAAMGNRKKTFLGQTAWKTIPWTKHPPSIRDQLLHVLADVPDILEAVDGMKECKDPAKRERWRKYLVNAALLCARNFKQWHDNHAEEMSRFLPDSGDLDVIITTRELASCHVMAMYWASCLVMASIQRDLIPPGLETAAIDQTKTAKADECFVRLVGVLPYLFHSTVGYFRIHLATLPFHVAALYLSTAVPEGKMEVERAIMREILQRPESTIIRQVLDGLGMSL